MIDAECHFCHYTTFLPTKCQHCMKEFCEKHFQPLDHRCPNYTPNIKRNHKETSKAFADLQKLMCIIPKCRSYTTITCDCGKQVCSQHRWEHYKKCPMNQ